MLCGRTDAYNNLVMECERERMEQEKEWLDQEKEWMVETMISATQGNADQRLSQLLERLCKQLEADVGSVYVWHAAANQLVLHTAYNWYVPKLGEASYKKGEGWTGGLVVNEEERVSVISSKASTAQFGSRKYYDYMVPPQARVPAHAPDPRIGVRLTADGELVGIVTFSYYADHADRLDDRYEQFGTILRAMIRLMTLGVERALENYIERETVQLRDTMTSVAEHLIVASRPGQSWQPVLDVIRTGFNVERVSLIPFQERPNRTWLDLEVRKWTPRRPEVRPRGAYRFDR